MKALISAIENNRIAQISSEIFEVADPLYWVDCPDTVTTEWTFENGKFYAPVILPAVIPTSVSMRQARLALLGAGLLSSVNAAIAAGGPADQITWEYATEVDRNSDLVVNLSQALGLSDVDLDNLFTAAAAL